MENEKKTKHGKLHGNSAPEEAYTDCDPFILSSTPPPSRGFYEGIEGKGTSNSKLLQCILKILHDHKVPTICCLGFRV